MFSTVYRIWRISGNQLWVYALVVETNWWAKFK
jgi:hypothetical protein